MKPTLNRFEGFLDHSTKAKRLQPAILGHLFEESRGDFADSAYAEAVFHQVRIHVLINAEETLDHIFA